MARISFSQIPASLMGSMMTTEQYIKDSQVADLRRLELMRYYVATLNECAYCMDMHFKEAIAAGESAQRLISTQVWRDTPFYSEEEEALLAWTECVALSHTEEGTREEVFQQMRRHYSLEEISILTLAISQLAHWTRLAKSFQFPVGSYQVGQFDH